MEFDGERYARASTHQKEWGQRLIAEREFVGDERILDLGCGDGVLTAKLADLVPQGSVLGLDASGSMLKTARKLERANLTFERLNIDDLAFEDEFEVVFSNATLHWVKDHERLLENVHKALRPGGWLRLNFAGEGNCRHFFAVVREVMALERFAVFFEDLEWPWYMPSVEEYRRLVGRFPFEESQVWGENADRHFPQEEALIAWIEQPSLVPFLPRLPEGRRKGFRDAVVSRMVAATRLADGRCLERFRRINVFGRK